MNKLKSFVILLHLGLVSGPIALHAQESLIQESFLSKSDHAYDLYNDALYGPAYKAFSDLLRDAHKQHTSDPLFWAKARFYKALSSLNTKENNPQEELLYFLESEQASIYANDAYIELADYYYREQDYKEAVYYFTQINLDGISNERYSEILFKKAYSHFVRKDFESTKTELRKIFHLKDQYYYAAHYYYGMSAYFTDDLNEAVNSFQNLNVSTAYKYRIPYYITQIYFKQSKYDDLLDYGNEVIQEPNTKNIKEIRGLLGQTYFLKKDYENAINHLAYYVDNTKKLRVEDFYQLGFAYYKTGQYKAAINPFVEIANEQSKLGQNANNYLAESYLKTNNKSAARSAFKRTSEMEFIPDLSEEALFNYGKLSADMGYDREALNILKKIQPSSIHFPESQKILSHVLNNTKDYAEALSFIENMEMQSPLIRETYQKIAYFYGMQFLLDQNYTEAKTFFSKSLKNPLNNYYTALTNYRMAVIENEKKNYALSKEFLNQYFSLQGTGLSLPEDASLPYANYLQAYNYLKSNNYTTARKYFADAANGFQKQGNKPKLRMDALLRAGDCYFQINKYNDAVTFYDKAAKTRLSGADYALYQRGILEGLMGKPYEKLVTMDDLIKNYPKSSLADFALYQNGETLLAINEPSEAEKSFRQIVDDYKNSSLRNKSLLKLGLIAFNQGNLTTSISYYKELFNFNPNAQESQEAYIALEEIYVGNLSKPEEFFDFIENQAGFKMNDFEKDSISFRSGDIPFENGEYTKAIDAYSSYLKRYPSGFNKILAHYRRAESYAINKEYARAFNDYESVIKQNMNAYYLPSLEKAALIAYNYLENYKKAFDYYSLLEELTPDNQKKYQAQMGALRSAARTDDRPAIIYMADKVLANPLITEDDRLVALFHQGKTHYSKNEFADAKKNLEEVVQKGENILAAEAHYLLGQIAFEEKDFVQAESIARDAIVKSKPYPYWVAKSLMLLSDVMVKKEDLLQAKAALEAIVENFKDNEEITEAAQKRLSIVNAMEEERSRIEQDSIGSDLKMEIDNNKND